MVRTVTGRLIVNDFETMNEMIVNHCDDELLSSRQKLECLWLLWPKFMPPDISHALLP